MARRRWAEFPYRRRFTVETLSFVQNTVQNNWIDLAHFSLNAVPVRVVPAIQRAQSAPWEPEASFSGASTGCRPRPAHASGSAPRGG